MTSIFRHDEDGRLGFDLDLAMMTMQASQCPVLVRRDPDGEWTVIAQGPPGVIHAHVITLEDAFELGVASVFDAAIDCARLHADRWRRHDTPSGPQLLREVLDALFPHLNDPREDS